MSDESRLLQRIRQQLDSEVAGQSPALQGKLRAARREVLAAHVRRPSYRLWLPAMAASLFAVIAISSLWLGGGAEVDSVRLMQAANEVDMQMLQAGDDIELYQNLEFYYWMQQELADAG